MIFDGGIIHLSGEIIPAAMQKVRWLVCLAAEQMYPLVAFLK
jgi:hypothetical protein